MAFKNTHNISLKFDNVCQRIPNFFWFQVRPNPFFSNEENRRKTHEKFGVTSIYEFLEIRFNKSVRLLGTSMFIIQDFFIKNIFLSLFLYLFPTILNKTSLYIGIVTYGPALALETVTGLDRWVSVWVRVLNHLENYYISIFAYLEHKILYVN